ncbi:dehydrogenase [Synergistales bacterium]|nr:dehydrogenase [Synergistales bacterium]
MNIRKMDRVRKIAITDCDHASMDDEKWVAEANRVELTLFQCRTEDDLIEKLKGYEVAANQYAPFTERVFAALKDTLKVVTRYGVGYNNIDVKAAAQYGIKICNVPDYGIQEVSVQALTLTLALTRKLLPLDHSVRRGEWEYQVGVPIERFSEMTIGIIGLGRIGKNFARLIRPFESTVLATDPLYPDKAPEEFSFVKMTSLEDLLRASDVVSIHCPLETSFHMLNETTLRMMKPRAFLINVSRGGIVDELALDRALTEGWIAGAACDVLEKEPPKGIHPLLRHENFVCTPHIAWYSEQASHDLKRKTIEELVRWLDGKELLNPVN